LFPTSVHTHEATFETIFGVHKRPTHRNTSWERARFEVSAHRFVDLSEPAYGVAVLNDGKYGHSVVGGTIGLSLVRGPLSPDPFADEGKHRFMYSLLPHPGDWIDAGVVHEAHALNTPLVAVPVAGDATGVPALVSIEGVSLGFSTLKRAHDRDGLVLRLYEPHGIAGRTVLTFSRDVRSATAVTLLEEDMDSPLEHDGPTVTLRVRPFQVISILLEI
jgi:alpha-mannosidase